MNLYMLRHGQTAASRENRFSGSSDPPLTAVGEAMAQAFAQAYASLKWDAIYTSPMLRARQTAEALCRLTGVQATVDDGLKEIDYGEWEGLRQDEVKERWPEAHCRSRDDGQADRSEDCREGEGALRDRPLRRVAVLALRASSQAAFRLFARTRVSTAAAFARERGARIAASSQSICAQAVRERC